MSVLRLENLHFYYGNPPAKTGMGGDNNESVVLFDNAQFTADHSQLISLQGQSGCGKTSLLMLIAGLIKPQSGRIFINDTEITNQNPNIQAEIRSKNIGMIFQQFHLLPFCTALENVMVSLSLHNIPNSLRVAMEYLDRVGLSKRARHFPSQLSGGEQQRVAIARALAVKPMLICADEPTGNLDETNGENIIQLLFDLAREHHSTILLVTHDNKIAGRCDKHFKLANKNIVAV